MDFILGIITTRILFRDISTTHICGVGVIDYGICLSQRELDVGESLFRRASVQV